MRVRALIGVALGVWSAVLLMFVSPVSAVPSYSRRYNIVCSQCHTVFGALTPAGVTFKLSGYRRIFGRDLEPTTKDIDLAQGALQLPQTLPLSIVGVVGFDYRSEDRKASSGLSAKQTGSSIDLDDISIFISTPVGKHLATFVEFPMFETKEGEFTPTGPGEAEALTKRSLQFTTEKPTFEVAKVFWNNLLGDMTPTDSLNAAFGITHPPLAYSPGKVRLSVQQYLIYERQALELIAPKKIGDFLSNDEQDRLFRLSEPQMMFELFGMLTPGHPVTDVAKPSTLWFEYHLGVTNASNDTADPNTQKAVYGRIVGRWYGQSLGFFALYNPDMYDDEMRTDAAANGVMSGRQRANAETRLGPDFTLSLVPFGIPLYLENQLMWNRDSDPMGFAKSFEWWGGFHQLNWRVAKPLIAYGRYDWIHGEHYNDTTVGGATNAKPHEWAGTGGVQYLVLENFKLTAEYRYREFENRASAPSHQHINENFFTLRASLGF